MNWDNTEKALVFQETSAIENFQNAREIAKSLSLLLRTVIASLTCNASSRLQKSVHQSASRPVMLVLPANAVSGCLAQSLRRKRGIHVAGPILLVPYLRISVEANHKQDDVNLLGILSPLAALAAEPYPSPPSRPSRPWAGP